MKLVYVLFILFLTYSCYADNDSLPNPAITPGTIFKDITNEQICTPNYSKSVRYVSESMKKRVFKAYGVINHPKGVYRIDHLIPLCIGGNNDFKNLWPLKTEIKNKKDRLEVRLKRLICTGHITKEQAQHEIATNWIAAYKKYIVEKSRGESNLEEKEDGD